MALGHPYYRYCPAVGSHHRLLLHAQHQSELIAVILMISHFYHMTHACDGISFIGSNLVCEINHLLHKNAHFL